MTKLLQSPASVHLLLLILLVFSAALTKSQECSPRCTTDNCNTDGACICDLPSDSSILQGDRHFLGGEFCDVPRTMCDGTNSFWCEKGHCNEIIQGENYTCICNEGYSGDHCELEGVQCGNIFCYHNGHCDEGEGSCDCPDDWKGSVDCSTPTTKTSQDTTTPEPVRPEMEDNNSWYVPVVVIMGVLVVGIGVICGVKSIRKQSRAASEFHKLRQVQMRGFIDEDEDAFAHAPLSKAELA